MHGVQPRSQLSKFQLCGFGKVSNLGHHRPHLGCHVAAEKMYTKPLEKLGCGMVLTGSDLGRWEPESWFHHFLRVWPF